MYGVVLLRDDGDMWPVEVQTVATCLSWAEACDAMAECVAIAEPGAFWDSHAYGVVWEA